MKAAPFEYTCAASTADAIAALGAAGEGTKICGGCQSLGPMLNLRLAQVDGLVDTSRIAALRGFEQRASVLRIGSAVTHSRIEDGEVPDVTRGLLPFVAAQIAYRAVRNRGTLGGSLAHADPAADWVSVMCLLNAGIVLQGAAGTRSVAATDFFLGPFTTALRADELIVAVDVPTFSAQASWSYRKVCRKPGEFADAIAAVWVDPQHGVARAMMGALSAMPHVVDGSAAVAELRDPARRDKAIGRMLDDAGADDAYEREVHAEMMRRALADLDAPQGSRA